MPTLDMATDETRLLRNNPYWKQLFYIAVHRELVLINKERRQCFNVRNKCSHGTLTGPIPIQNKVDADIEGLKSFMSMHIFLPIWLARKTHHSHFMNN